MLDSLILLTHIIFGSAFVFTMAVMQIGVGPAMSRMKECPDKAKGAAVIQGRIKPAMDVVIVVMSLTVVYFLFTRLDMILSSHILMTKGVVGITALTLANLLHFYWRAKKVRLKEAGKTDEFMVLNSRTLLIEKIVLSLAAVTFLMAITFNHL